MKTYKQFNESIRDLLKPKNEDDILKELDGLFDNEKTEKIIQYQLDYDLLPRNENGKIVYEGRLKFFNEKLTRLPDNLIVKGDFDCSYNQLTELPYNLIVKGYFDCSFNKLIKLSDNLIVGGNLWLNFNRLTKLPKGLKIGGDLHLEANSENHRITIPEDAEIKGEIYY